MLRFIASVLAFSGLAGDQLPAADAQSSLVIEVQETAGIRRFQYPLAVKLQLTGPVPRESQFRLLCADRAMLAQFRPAEPGETTAAWWLDFPVDLLPYQSQTYRVDCETPPPDSPVLKRGLALSESEACFQVVNEPAIAWTAARNLTGLLQSVRSGELEYVRPESLGLLLLDRGGTVHRLCGSQEHRDVQAQVTRQGPLAVGLRFEALEKSAALAGVRSTVDLTWPLFKSWVEVDWHVADPHGQVAGLGAQLDMHLDEPTGQLPTLVDFGATSLVYAFLPPGQTAVMRGSGTGDGTSKTAPNEAGAWEILRGPSGGLQPFVSGPQPAAAGTRPEGWVHLMDRRRCLALAVDGFARDAADQISVAAGGTVRIERRITAGAAETKMNLKRLHFWLHFIPFPPQQTAATSPQSMQTPPTIRVRS